MAKNGTFTRWALGLLGAIILALGAWTGKSVIEHGQAIASQESRQESFEKWLDRVDKKLDRALRHLPRDGVRQGE